MLGKIQKDLIKLLAFFGGLFLFFYLGFFCYISIVINKQSNK